MNLCLNDEEKEILNHFLGYMIEKTLDYLQEHRTTAMVNVGVGTSVLKLLVLISEEELDFSIEEKLSYRAAILNAVQQIVIDFDGEKDKLHREAYEAMEEE